MYQIIVADIFGRTKALDEIAAGFSENVEILDPYNAEIMAFENEAEAYSYFTTNVGLDVYVEYLLEVLRALTDNVSLLGFSVGASAIWKVSNQGELKNITGAKCFYGSQIRHYKDINPLFPVQLIFPATEPHFSASDLIADLSGKENVQISQVAFLHGFMNSHSQNYDPEGYAQFMQGLCNAPFDRPIHATVFSGI